METAQPTKNVPVLQPIKEITGFLLLYSTRLLCGGLSFAVLTTIFQPRGGFDAGGICVGILFIISGILLRVLAREFIRLRRWTYPIVKFLVGGWWGLRGTEFGGYHQKVRSPEVRAIFGLEPLPDYDKQNHEGQS
jgi:hypothetical protein